jgi:hypothetical protein
VTVGVTYHTSYLVLPPLQRIVIDSSRSGNHVSMPGENCTFGGADKILDYIWR